MNSSVAQQKQLFAMLGAMASQFDDDDGEIAAKMAQLQTALATRDAVVAGEHKKLASMQEAAIAGGGNADEGPSAAALCEIQSQIRTVENDLAATERALAAPESEEARQLLAATMPAWAPAVIPGAVGAPGGASEASLPPHGKTAAAVSGLSRSEPEPERAPVVGAPVDNCASETQSGEANGYGTIAVDLAAEAKKVADLKARGLNPDGTPYIHLPGQNEAPP